MPSTWKMWRYGFKRTHDSIRATKVALPKIRDSEISHHREAKPKQSIVFSYPAYIPDNGASYVLGSTAVMLASSLAIEANQRTVLGSRILGEAMLIAMDPLGVAMQSWGVAEWFGIHNKQQTTSCIIPNNKGGASLALLVRF